MNPPNPDRGRGLIHSLRRARIRLQIKSLNDLERKIIGVFVAALAVAFLGLAAGGDEPGVLLNYGGGVAFEIAALAYFTVANNLASAQKKAEKDE